MSNARPQAVAAPTAQRRAAPWGTNTTFRTPRVGMAVALSACAAVLASPAVSVGSPRIAPASAGADDATVAQGTLPWELTAVFPVAVRLVRVDQGFKVTERDADAGYILFEFTHGRATGTGSLELVPTHDVSGRAATRLRIATQGGPFHLPHTLLSQLELKLRDELGAPAAPPPRDKGPSTPPSTPPGGADKSPSPSVPPAQEEPLVIPPGVDPGDFGAP